MTRSAGDARRLTEIFLAATGSRQALTVLVPVRLPHDPPWAAGPLPFLTNDGPSELRARAQLFTPSAARALHDHRWHVRPALTQGPLCLDAMELLRTPTARSPEQTLAALHFTVTGAPMLPLLRALPARRPAVTVDHRPAGDAARGRPGNQVTRGA